MKAEEGEERIDPGGRRVGEEVMRREEDEYQGWRVGLW